jgi:hypothetical protein
MPNGGNVNCNTPLKRATALFIYDADYKYSTASAVDNKENQRVLIQETEKLIVLPVRGMEVTGSEVQVTTDPYGDNLITGETSGGLRAYVKTNACDFKEMLQTFKGGTYRVGAFLDDGSVYLSQDGDGVRGIKSNLYAEALNMPTQDGADQQFVLRVDFQSIDEIRDFKIIPVNYTINELLDYVPVGLSMSVTAISTTSFTATVTTRCTSTPFTSDLTFEPISGMGNVEVPSFTPTNNADGTYTVVTTKDTVPTSFAAGDYQKFRAVAKTGAVIDYVTNVETAQK